MSDTALEWSLVLAASILILMSIRLDEASIRNFVSVTIGALPAAWVAGHTQDPWAKAFAVVFLCLAILMTPLGPPLIIIVSYPLRKLYRLLSDCPARDRPQEPSVANPALINVLADPPGADVDIVAVHGLGSSVESTWTHKTKTSKSLWLQDFLPADLPNARIMTYRHNSNWESEALEKDLVDHGRQLLGALEGKRATSESKNRPLIFVGHSFGGLLIQQALVLAKRATGEADPDTRERHKSLTKSFAGAIFLGTPHAGSSYSLLGSKETMDLEDEFRKYFRGLSIDYYESKPWVILGIKVQMVVTRESGTRRGEQSNVLDTDHFGLNKFESREDASYQTIKDKMVAMIESRNNKMNREKYRSIVRINEFHQWLSNLDPSERHQALCRKRHIDTGFWILEGEFEKWVARSQEIQLLWIHGLMGSGKSVLASRIIDEVRELCDTNTGENLTFAYFYFDFNNTDYQQPMKMIRSLLFQLGTMNEEVNKWLEQRLQVFWVRKEQPPDGVIWEALRELIQQFKTTYIILDALDECTDWRELRSAISRMLGWGENLKVLLISRKEPEIEEDLGCLDPKPCSISLQGKGVNRDMRTYIQSMWNEELKPWAKRLEKHPKRRMQIEQELISKSEGMFRWLELQLIDLRSFCDTNDGKGLEEKLNSLPRGLDETYFRILSCATDRKRALRVLQWLSFSAKPMTIREVAQAMALEVDEDGNMAFNHGSIPDPPQYILKLCPGLFNTIVAAGSRQDEGEVSADDQIRLAHFSVKEYLQSDSIRRTLDHFHIQKIPTNIYQARACLAFMAWFQSPDCNMDITEESVSEYPFAAYSAECWPAHARIAASVASASADELARSRGDLANLRYEASRLAEGINQMLCSQSSLLTWIRLFDPDHQKPRFDATGTDVLSPLYYASLSGLQYQVEYFINRGDEIEVEGGRLGRPLRAACRDGFLPIVRFLIHRGAAFPQNQQEDEWVFQVAAKSGNVGLVRYLLDKENDTVPGQITHADAMFEAVSHGFTNITSLLVNSENVNVDVYKPNDPGRIFARLLEVASARGQASMAARLLELGADINFEGGWYGTAIRAAALQGYNTVVRVLLENGADPHLSGDSPGSAMMAAIAFDRASIIDTFLQHDGFDVNNYEGMDGSQLQVAASKGNLELVRKLLERGAHVDIEGGCHHTALQAACFYGHAEVARLLLEYGASPDVSEDGPSEIECLTISGDVLPRLYWRPWKRSGAQYRESPPAAFDMFAPELSDEEKTQLSIRGYQTTFQKGLGGTPLRSAVISGSLDIVKQLLDRNASTERRGGAVCSVLTLARCLGHSEIETLLQSAGARALEGEEIAG